MSSVQSTFPPLANEWMVVSFTKLWNTKEVVLIGVMIAHLDIMNLKCFHDV